MFLSCTRNLIWVVILGLFVTQASKADDASCLDNQGNPLPHCLMLEPGTRALVQATDCGNSDSTSRECPGSAAILKRDSEDRAPCRTVINESAQSYRVLWDTPQDWGAFLAMVRDQGKALGLSIERCCLPMIGTVCANQLYKGFLVGPMGLIGSHPVQLGHRVVNRRLTNFECFGAEDDVSPQIVAATTLDDPQLSEVSRFVCMKGKWILASQTGNCAITALPQPR